MKSVCILLWMLFLTSIESFNPEDQTQEIIAARCYSKCLQIFIRFNIFKKEKGIKKTTEKTNIRSSRYARNAQSFVKEMAHNVMIDPQSLHSCLKDVNGECSRQCFKSCPTSSECICQQGDTGCLLACFFRKEISKERNQDDCPFLSTAKESALKVPSTRCPGSCKSRADCSGNQQCCNTETCGPICIQFESHLMPLPKYQPIPTQSSSSSSIEFDWSETFSSYLKDELPLVFILQTRTCFCYKVIEKYTTPWQTLVMTHRLGAKLNALDNGTIYQFRLAAVSPFGSDGFGSISQDLPRSISKPPPPFPPENFIEYKWEIVDETSVKVEVSWTEPKPSSWRSYEYLLTWMVDHGVVQFGEEHMSSLTQYTKTLPGSVNRSIIVDLKPSTTYKMQIVTKVDWPGYGDILSKSVTMYISTPAAPTSKHNYENLKFNDDLNSCPCPEPPGYSNEIKIQGPTIKNGNLQINIKLREYSDYEVDICPESCINSGYGNNSSALEKSTKLFKQTSEITLSHLQYNCKYSLRVTKGPETSSNATYQICFCTPTCQNAHRGSNCPNDDILPLSSPKNLRYTLFNYDTMTYKVTWEPIQDMVPKRGSHFITKYRIFWAPRKFEPVPLNHYNSIIGFEPAVDVDQSNYRVVRNNVTRLLLPNLLKDKLYIVQIQSLATCEQGQLLESNPVKILLPTHGFTDMYYENGRGYLSHSPLLTTILLSAVPQLICNLANP